MSTNVIYCHIIIKIDGVQKLCVLEKCLDSRVVQEACTFFIIFGKLPKKQYYYTTARMKAGSPGCYMDPMGDSDQQGRRNQ